MRRITPLLIAMLLVPVAATGQETAHSFTELVDRQLLRKDDKVRVVCAYESADQYTEIEAELISVTPSALYVALDQPVGRTDLETAPSDDGGQQVEIPAHRVASITRGPRSSYGKDVGVGVAIGAAAGAGLGWYLCQRSDCDDDERAGPMALGVGLGAAAGATLGALVASAGDPSEELVYSAAGSGEPRFSYSVSPIVTKRRKGALFTVIW